MSVGGGHCGALRRRRRMSRACGVRALNAGEEAFADQRLADGLRILAALDLPGSCG